MTDIVKRLRKGDPCGDCKRDRCACVIMDEAADEITRLTAENFSLASWQCEFTDGKTGLVSSEGGSTYCAMAKRVEALRAEVEKLRAALREIVAMDEVAIVEFKKGDGWLHQRVARAALEEKDG